MNYKFYEAETFAKTDGYFCFTVDDNIRFLKKLNAKKREDIFSHAYLNIFRKLHLDYGIKVQLNLFYECDDFNLSGMTDEYKEQFERNADWLKMSFHSKAEDVRPYENAG